MPTPVWSISQFLPAFLSWATLATTYQNVLWCLSLVLTCDLPHPLSHTSSRCVLIFFSEMGKLRLKDTVKDKANIIYENLLKLLDGGTTSK